MRKLLNNPRIVAVLALCAVLVVGYSVYPRKASSGRAAPAASSLSPHAGSPVDSASHDDTAAPGDFTAMGTQEALAALLALSVKPRDPFALPPKPVAAAPAATAEPLPDIVEQLHLSAIWIQGAECWLLVNGRIARAGDVVGRITIESAAREGVWLKHWKGRDFITVGERFELKTPATQLATLAAH